jgi:hypothetical protein
MNQATFSDRELGLVIELLERERTQLFTEIRHTDTRTYRVELHDRLQLVEGLLAHMKPAVAEARSAP